MQMKYTMGPELLPNMYHIETIRSRLNRNLSSLYPEIQDEVSVTFDEILDLSDNGEYDSSIVHSLLLKLREFRVEECACSWWHLPDRMSN